MKIKSIIITRRSTYSITADNPAKFEGKITLEGNISGHADMTIGLDPDRLAAVLALVAPVMVDATTDALEELRREAVDDAARLGVQPGQLIEQQPAA